MGKKHRNRKEYPGKQQNEWENNNIEEPSNEDTSFTAKEVFANSQVDANAEEESDTEAEEEFTETAEEVFANSYVDARAGEESDTEEELSETAEEVFASSQVDARAGEETYAEEAEGELSETAEEVFTSSNVDASMKTGIEVEDTTAKVSEVVETSKEQKLENAKPMDTTSQKQSESERKESNPMIVPVFRKNSVPNSGIESSLASSVAKATGDAAKASKEKKVSAEEFNSYEFAKIILDKYSTWHLDPSDWALWIYNGRCYEPLNDKKLGDLIYAELPKEIKLTTKSCKKIIENVADYIVRECTANPLDIEKSGKYYKTFREKDIRSIYGQVVLENGIYDVMTGTFQKQFTSEKPYYYQIKAKYLKEKMDMELCTPNFDKLLRDATGGDETSIRMIEYALGMLLLPNKCKKFVVAGNASNSGKSVLFGQFLESLFDGSRISRIDSSKLGGRFALGDCEDKLLISCLDIDEKVLSSKSLGVIKRVTGDGKVSGEAKYKSAKEIIARFKFVFATNFGFTSQKYDAGLVNRMLVLPFVCETKEEDQCADLPEKLQSEKDKIVTKILRRMKDVVAKDGSIVIKESNLSRRLKYDWTTSNSFFAEFCEECIKVTGDENDYTSKKELYEAYKNYFWVKCQTASGRGNYILLQKMAFEKNLDEQIIFNSQGRVKSVRSRNYGNEQFKNPVRRLTGIRLLD